LTAKRNRQFALLFAGRGRKVLPISNRAIRLPGSNISRNRPQQTRNQTRAQSDMIFTQRIAKFDRAVALASSDRAINEEVRASVKPMAIRSWRSFVSKSKLRSASLSGVNRLRSALGIFSIPWRE